MLVKTIVPTVIKQQPVELSAILENNKHNIPAFTTLEVNWIKPLNEHYIQVSLVKAIKGYHNWFIYKPHLDVDDLPKTSINLPIPYLSQRDNVNKPYGTCNITCVAMCLSYFGVLPANKRVQLEDEMFAIAVAQGWDRHVHDHLVKLVKLYGFKDTFKVNTSWSAIKSHLLSGLPVILSARFTKSGHIIVLRGFDDSKKVWFVNDPYGEYFSTGYKNVSGENLEYSYELLEKLSYGEPGTTWAHLVSR